MINLTDEDIDNWIAALRSGKYKQGYNSLLRDINDNFCCLGVLCNIHPEIKNNISISIAHDCYKYFDSTAMVSNFIDINYKLLEILMYMNDEQKISFSGIADYIEKHRNKFINRRELSEKPDQTD